MFAPDGKTLFYVSDVAGTPGALTNIVRQPLDGSSSSPPQSLTHHKEDSVRRARLSRGGEWIVYECGADLWVVSTKGGTPRKLAIEAYADDKINPDRTVTYTSNMSEFGVANDDHAIAFVVHGQLFCMPRTGGKAKRLTDNPYYDHAPVWSPDSRKLAFLSDRTGHENIYRLESAEANNPAILKANSFKVKQLTRTDAAEQGVNFSPDGKRLSFIRNGRLMTMNLEGDDEKVIVNEPRVIDYEWSPDGRWIAFARLDGSFASEIYIVPSEGATAKDTISNVTGYATFNADITWGKLASSNAVQHAGSIFVMSRGRPAQRAIYQDIDFEDVHLRVVQPTRWKPEGPSRRTARVSPSGRAKWR
jgi:tricorn protease